MSVEVLEANANGTGRTSDIQTPFLASSARAIPLGRFCRNFLSTGQTGGPFEGITPGRKPPPKNHWKDQKYTSLPMARHLA